MSTNEKHINSDHDRPTLVQFAKESNDNFDDDFLKTYLPGFEEPDDVLLDNARQDLIDATVLLVKLENVQPMDHDESRLHSITVDLVERAIKRIEICRDGLQWKREHDKGGAS